MTIDERLEALVKASEEQGRTIDRILAGLDKITANFQEFQEDRNQINRSMQTLIQKVDKLTDNVDRLERFFERTLKLPPNGKTKGGDKK